MPNGDFKITELRTNGIGGDTDPLVFTWTAFNRSAPRGSWKFGVEQRTQVTHYPGSPNPVEQILGANFKPFEVSGVWDDRYNSQGYALETFRAFETLVARGNLCRIEFESVSVTGIIQNAEFDYKRADYIGYSFTVSPHYRVEGRPPGYDAVSPENTYQMRPISEFTAAVGARRDALVTAVYAISLLAVRPELARGLRADVQALHSNTEKMFSAVQARVNNAVERVDQLRRLVSSLSVIKGNAIAMMYRAHSDDWEMAVADAKGVWNRAQLRADFASNARLLFKTSYEAVVEFTRHMASDALTIYHPHQGESLYSISQRFYGSPGQWRLIAERNSLSTITLQGNETLIIPRPNSTTYSNLTR